MEGTDIVLRNFMEEFFPFEEMRVAGLFREEIRGDYKAQAARICRFFGFETVYEYRARGFRGHITYAKGHRPKGEPFVSEWPSIYD